MILAIISIARGLNLGLVAEGVETEAQYAYLKANDCKIMQGYRFSPAVSRSEFLALQGSRKKKQAG